MIMSESTNSESCQATFVGSVQVVYDQNDHRSRYLEAYCGNSENRPARLRIIESTTSNARAVIEEILFTAIKQVNCTDDRVRKLVALQMLEDDICVKFYADSEPDTMRWFRYCGLLSSLPFCTIPNIPQRNFVTQRSIDEYTDPKQFDATCLWVVYILNEGIVKDNVDLNGLCVITIRSSDSTFNIHDFNTGKHLLSWDQASIIRCGGVESLVFLQASTRCSEGPGLLWVQHPVPQSLPLQRCLQQFICFGPESVSQPKPPAFSVLSHTSLKFKSTASKVPLTNSGSCESFSKCAKQHKKLPASHSKTPHSYNFATYGYRHTAKKHIPVSSQNSANSLCSSGYVSDGNSLTCDTLSRDFHTSISSTLTSDSCVPCESPDCCTTGSKYDSCKNIHVATSVERTPLNVSTKSPSLSLQSQDCKDSSIHNSSANSSELNPITLPPKGITRILLHENHDLDSCRLDGRKQDCTSDVLSAVSSLQNLSGHLKYSCEPIPMTMGSTKSLSCPEAVVGSSPVPSNEVSAFQKCSATILEKLNLPAILPYLVAQNMVTQRDLEIITSSFTTDVNKTVHLISILPSKGDGFLGKFVLCLCQSKLGTSHDDIVKSLTTTLNEVKRSGGTLRLGENRKEFRLPPKQ